MQVEVFSAATNKTYFFFCNAWLKKEGSDTSGLRKELVASTPDTSGAPFQPAPYASSTMSTILSTDKQVRNILTVC